jgi:stage II sporulation protein M
LILWFNNLRASFIAVVTGILVIPSLIMLAVNGIGIGLIQTVTVAKIHITPWQFYMSVAVHGILELPAVFIAVGLGIRLGLLPFRALFHCIKNRNSEPSFVGHYWPSLQEYISELKYYGLLIVAMLFVAAVLEITVSPLVVQWIFNKPV